MMAVNIGDTSSDYRPNVAWVNSLENVVRAMFALFLTTLVALLIALYAGVPLPEFMAGIISGAPRPFTATADVPN